MSEAGVARRSGAHRWSVVLILPLFSGCGLVLDIGDTPDGADASNDSGPADASVAPDASPASDASPAVDGSLADAGPPPAPCAPGWLDEGVFSAYGFDGDLADRLDATMHGEARPAGVEAVFRTEPGPTPGCDQALTLGGGRFVVIAHRPEWDEVRSIDFWLLSPNAPFNRGGVISRDASGEARPGHMTLARTRDEQLMLRVQVPPIEGDNDEKHCSEPTVDLSQWVHVGINLGDPAEPESSVELWVDGVRMDAPLVADLMTSAFGCDNGAGDPVGIAGNENPWVVGASSHPSDEGFAEPIEYPHPEGAIDELRFSRVRRDFRLAARP